EDGIRDFHVTGVQTCALPIWREGADHETVGDEGGVRRRRQVVAMAHQRADVTPVEPYHGVVAVPADHVQRVVRIGHRGDLVAPRSEERRVGKESRSRWRAVY